MLVASEKMKSLYLIDISSFIFRAYYAIKPLSTKEGIVVNAVYGVVSMLNRLIQTHKPDHLVVCRDTGEKGFRHTIYPQYKANREKPPEDLIPQFDLIKEFVEIYPFKVLQKSGYEADDVMATLVRKFRNQKDMRVVIVSSDKDLMQLVGGNVIMHDSMKEKEIHVQDVIEKFGVPPEKVVDIQSLCGDSSDNIPGITGVGPKTATKLIVEHGSLEKVLAAADHITGKLGENLRTHKEDALLSKKLVTLVDDLDLDVDWNSMMMIPPDVERLRAFYEKMGFRRFAEELGGGEKLRIKNEELIIEGTKTEVRQKIHEPDFITVKDQKELGSLCHKIQKAKKPLAIDTETDSLNVMRARLVGFSFCFEDDRAYYVPLGHVLGENLDLDEFKKSLGPILNDPKIPKVAQNAKFDLNVLETNGLKLQGLVDDTLIASYLLNPEGQHGLDYLADKYFGFKMLNFDDVVPKKQTFADVSVDVACRYSAADAWVAFNLNHFFQEQLQQNELAKIYTEIEMPLVSILARMERNGILIDLDFLDKLEVEFTARLSSLERKIHELAGEAFNINSPKQLSVILFEKLKLPTIRKTKTGFSTDVDVLEELADKHELPKSLLQFRTVTKLLSTYIVGLKDLTDQHTHRLHSHFNQAVVATGRLSSSEPNLQNIPIKTEEGRRIREAFIAPERCVLVSADYSQIELRLLAAFSKDPHLIEAYQKNQDIHAKTAAHIFDVAIDDVEPYQRSIAKTINFGVIYGQSPFGLAQQLGVPQAEAKRFIEGFYHEFGHVRDFKEETLSRAREQGFVTTYLGRRRYLPDINSRNNNVRQNAERMAFNTVFQGSAADLIKKAMIMIDQELTERKLKTRMLLQVHDELVFEVPKEELEEVQNMVKRIMESAFDVGVPITVSCATGKTWAEAHG